MAISRSVRMPRGCIPSATTTSPMSLSRIMRAASQSDVCGSTVATSVTLTSLTWGIIACLLSVSVADNRTRRWRRCSSAASALRSCPAQHAEVQAAKAVQVEVARVQPDVACQCGDRAAQCPQCNPQLRARVGPTQEPLDLAGCVAHERQSRPGRVALVGWFETTLQAAILFPTCSPGGRRTEVVLSTRRAGIPLIAMRTVADALSESVLVDDSMTLQDASSQMLDAGAEAAVVVEDDALVGLITADDVARALAEGRDVAMTVVGAIADRDPLLARAGEPLVDVHQRMRMQQRPLAVAVGAHGEPLG